MNEVRLIDAEALKKEFAKFDRIYIADTGNELVNAFAVDKIIDNAPTVEPKKEIVPVCKVTFDKEQLQEIVDKKVAEMIERPQGEWTIKDAEFGFADCICDKCKSRYAEPIRELYNYCPNCGARMKGGEKND